MGRGVDDIRWGRHQGRPASPGWRGRGRSFPQRLGPSCDRGGLMFQGLDLPRLLDLQEGEEYILGEPTDRFSS